MPEIHPAPCTATIPSNRLSRLPPVRWCPDLILQSLLPLAPGWPQGNTPGPSAGREPLEADWPWQELICSGSCLLHSRAKIKDCLAEVPIPKGTHTADKIVTKNSARIVQVTVRNGFLLRPSWPLTQEIPNPFWFPRSLCSDPPDHRPAVRDFFLPGWFYLVLLLLKYPYTTSLFHRLFAPGPPHRLGMDVDLPTYRGFGFVVITVPTYAARVGCMSFYLLPFLMCTVS